MIVFLGRRLERYIGNEEILIKKKYLQLKMMIYIILCVDHVNNVVKLPVQSAVRIIASHDGELFFRITFISFLIKIGFIAIFVKTCF